MKTDKLRVISKLIVIFLKYETSRLKRGYCKLFFWQCLAKAAYSVDLTITLYVVFRWHLKCVQLWSWSSFYIRIRIFSGECFSTAVLSLNILYQMKICIPWFFIWGSLSNIVGLLCTSDLVIIQPKYWPMVTKLP